MEESGELAQRWQAIREGVEVDAYGLPAHAFGDKPPSEFFVVLGRILAVNSQIEYLQERLDHLPKSETVGVRKVEQFLARCASGRADRNAIVHSRWVFGAHETDPEVIFGLRYKIRRQAAGHVATVSIRDVRESEKEQEIVQYTVDSLKILLRSNVTTMRIGELAYSEIMTAWSVRQLAKTQDGDTAL